MRYAVSAVAVTLLAGCVAPVPAQRSACEDLKTRAAGDSRAAIDLLRSGRALGCPQFSEIVDAAVRGLWLPPTYSGPDPDSAWALAAELARYRDRSIFDTGIVLATDSAAHPVVRAMGLLILSTQVGGSLVYYSDENSVHGGRLLTTPLDTTQMCGMDLVLGDPLIGPNLLPPDHDRVAAKVMDRISADPGEPLLLRRLAACGRPYGVAPLIDENTPPQGRQATDATT